MADWRNQLRASHERLQSWFRVGGIDEHTRTLGLHVLAAMHEMKTTKIRASLSHFCNTFLYHGEDIVVGPVSDLDIFYLGALQNLQYKIGIYNDASEDRVDWLMDTHYEESAPEEERMWERAHVSQLYSDQAEYCDILPETPLVFCATDHHYSHLSLESVRHQARESHARKCPSWMAR